MKIRLTRRRFLLGTASAAAAVGAYTWRVEPHWVTVTRRDLPVRNLPPALAGRTLAQVSDLHVCPRVDTEYLGAALREVSALQPDIVVVTGDFVSNASPERSEEVARLLENLAATPLGCFGAFGNHDYGERWSDMGAAEHLEKRLTGAGVTVLRNASHVVKGLTLVGVDDLWGPNFYPKPVLSKLSADEPAIVLCHNPDAVDGPVWGAFRGWILSGHTHGGQCKPPFLPPPLLPVVNRRYTSGAFDLGDGRALYINCGLGYLRRVRFNVRPEITLFTLVPA
ncbi:metallophosphoesterase [Frigoriglobus tundricola]|uniref:Phosphoesterase n=1 Tax=Frigoriglobus tundricola TaxID=2774151 RepID=A0A6M5YXH3_9BACT|nr:metallophosphoesterase [Frigoriglobus tundricola]QJW97903.1 Phosphoesterase [Frigoriglobus tundricola]